jgi:hypothetical protein
LQASQAAHATHPSATCTSRKPRSTDTHPAPTPPFHGVCCRRRAVHCVCFPWRRAASPPSAAAAAEQQPSLPRFALHVPLRPLNHFPTTPQLSFAASPVNHTAWADRAIGATQELSDVAGLPVREKFRPVNIPPPRPAQVAQPLPNYKPMRESPQRSRQEAAQLADTGDLRLCRSSQTLPTDADGPPFDGGDVRLAFDQLLELLVLLLRPRPHLLPRHPRTRPR